MKYLRLLLLLGVLSLLNACGDTVLNSTPTATAVPTQALGVPTTVVDTPLPTQDVSTPSIVPEPTLEPTVVRTISPTPNEGSANPANPTTVTDVTAVASQVTTDTMSADLERMLNARLTPTPEGSTDSHIEGVHVTRVQGKTSPLWVANTYGLRNFDPQETHFVAVYSHPNEKWQELGRLALDLPDYLDPGSVTQIRIEPTQLWLQVEGGAGAHGGVFYVLRFDGTTLSKEIEFSGSSPNAADVRDINGDGVLDVLENATDAYVFCYACGVQLINYDVMRWDGSKMVKVELQPLSPTVPAEARRLNDLALTEIKGELWKVAKENIDKAKTLAPQDETLGWNAALIGLTAGARQAHIKDSGHPLMETIFYGDYDAAIAGLRKYSPEELFGPQTPIIVGTPAEGNEDSLRKSIIDTTTKALVVDPNLAGALFLRGWAEFVPGKPNTAATSDIKHAAELNPQEELFKNAAAYMTNK